MSPIRWITRKYNDFNNWSDRTGFQDIVTLCLTIILFTLFLIWVVKYGSR